MNVTRSPRPRVLVAAAAVLVAVVVVVALLTVTGGRPALSRDQRWRQDVAYLASHLPQVHVGGLLGVRRSSWEAAAAHLEAALPRLTDGQVIVGMARMVAMLHDDETLLLLPHGAGFPVKLTWIGGQLCLVIVPSADRELLGAQILEVDGHPLAQVLSLIASVIDYQDPGLLRNEAASYLMNFPALLYWLGITRSPDGAAFTVRAVSGARQVIQLRAVAHVQAGGVARVPKPLYERDQGKPYWLQILSSQRAVYLKYNDCLNDNGFQQLAAEAIAVLRRQPSYRLIVDLRNNGGGDTQPFTSLIEGLLADPALHGRDRIFGLVNPYTDSSATDDADSLRQVPNAVLIGQPPGDPINEYGNEAMFSLPLSGIVVVYATKIVNDTGRALATPDLVVGPTIRQVLAGIDPVLAAALSYGR